ncbi:MAG: hypothetical protein H6557_04535 [Lewinellaceae bacterium]|nr:hypothetical protein [Phaeodactylibacter sp.]MCB9035869.1 hypothetical protein [Lewinellaceae bacterium]
MTNLPPTQPDQFIPLHTFVSRMPHAEGFPYATRLSFEPLLHYLQEKGENSEQPLKGLYKKLHAQVMPLQQRINDGQIPETLEGESALETLMSLYFPLNQQEEGRAFAGQPFDSGFMFRSRAMKQLFEKESLEVHFSGKKDKLSQPGAVLKAGSLILQRCYGQAMNAVFPDVIRLRDRQTKLESYYRYNIVLDFVRIKPLKPLPELSRDQASELLDNLFDQDLWLQCFPPENFAFEGLVLGYMTDVTEAEVWSRMQEGLIGESQHDGREMLDFLENQVRNYLREPDLRVGAMPLWWHASREEVMRASLLEAATDKLGRLPSDIEGSPYQKALRQNGPLVIEDLEKEPPNPVVGLLLELGYKNVILIAQKNEDGEAIGMLELGMPRAHSLNSLTLLKLRDVFALANLNFNRVTRELQDAVQLAIQRRYTSIHQSVLWKFRRAAQQLLFEGQDADDSIVFKDVYPLYGQADIVSSSSLRSESIRADLQDNLALLEGVLEKCLAQSRFNLLDHYLLKVKKLKSRIEEEFYSSDENVVTDLLLYDVHPFLRYLGEQDGSLGETVLEPYFQMLDPQLGILYRQRKDYEKSVEKLNILLGKFMDEEQEKMQKLLPHYFEIYKTDGVEYNIYLGQSILEEGQFLDYHLKDFRLWQLVSLCEATRLVEREARRFPTPLSTAQLIFVYNNPISIRFRMDDKRFDVDGAYNVRYEIIKKRIDKATIKGTEERLTQQGKIAIVYLHEKDHQEYLDYIGYLVEKGYASPEVEELELNRLQGADGLKALRVTVVG